MTRFRSFAALIGALTLLLASYPGAGGAPELSPERPDGGPLPPHALYRFGTPRFRHGEAVGAVAISADGSHVATGGRDRSVIIWEARSGREVGAVRGTGDPVAVALSPDGKRVAVNFGEDAVRIAEARSDQAGREIPAAFATSLAFSPDGTQLASAERDGSVNVRDADTGKYRLKVAGTALAFSPDGKVLAVGDAKGVLTLWTIAADRGKPLAEGGKEKVTAVAYAPDGTAVAAADAKQTRVYDLEGKKVRCTIPVGGKLAFAAGGKVLAVGAGGKVRFFDPITGKPSGEALEGTPLFAASTDGKVLVTVAPESRVRLWDFPARKERPTAAASHAFEVAGVAFTPDGRSLISAGPDGFRLWDPKTGMPLPAPKDGGPVLAFALSADGKRLVTVGPEAVGVWEPAEGRLPGEPKRTIDSRPGTAPFVVLAPDGRIALGAPEKRLRLADPATGKLLAPLDLPSRPVAAAFAPDSRHLAVLTTDGLLRLYLEAGGGEGWQSAWGKRVQRVERGAVAFDPDGHLVAVSSGGRVCVLEAVTGRQWFARDREWGEGNVQALAFSPDGRVLASGSGGPEGKIRLWDATTGKELRRYRGHRGGVGGTPGALAFAPDGRTLASAGADSTVALWEADVRPAEAAPLTNLETAWDGLDSLDIATAYRAMRAMQSGGSKGVPAIRAGLKRAREDHVRIRKWIDELDDEQFRVREAATKNLVGQGLRAVPYLRAALEAKVSAEKEQRIKVVIDRMEERGVRAPSGGLFGEPLRTVRAVLILERAGTPEARELLEAIAATKDDTRERREARSALARWKR